MHSSHPLTLFMTEQHSLHERKNHVHFIWTGKECLDAATILRLPRRCLHKLPSQTAMNLADFSLEFLLSRVEHVAYILSKPNSTISDTLRLRQKNDVLTFILFRIMHHLSDQKGAEVPGHSIRTQKRKASSTWDPLIGTRKDRKKSIWEEGGVPWNGGQ